MRSIVYSPEIDGLRAVAVLAVIMFHTDLYWTPGGYIGVDVFFVVSGFLITRILLTYQDITKATLLDFFERRCRRIVPALFAMIFVTSIWALLYLMPSDMRDLGEAAVYVGTFLGNFFF